MGARATIAALGVWVAALACHGSAAEPADQPPSQSPPAPPDPTPDRGEPETPEPEPEEPEPEPESLAATLRSWAGEASPLLLAREDQGLLASDGERERVLVESPIIKADYDAARTVIWYVSGDQLLGLDLLDPAGAAHVVAKQVPDESIWLPDADTWLGAQRVPEYMVVRWAEAPEIEVGFTFEDVINEHVAEAIREAELVDRTWLATLATREARAVPESPKAQRYTKAPLAECWAEEEACGRGIVWPNTSWRLYVSEYDCGDYCYWSCGLWDSKTGQTADPRGLPTPSWTKQGEAFASNCGPFWTDAAQTAIATNERLCRGQQCWTYEGHGLGFLDPGPTLEAGP